MAGRLFDLTGKVALVTGASRGMGLAMARELAAHGAQVMISARGEEALAEAARAANAAIGAERVHACAAHAGRPEEVERLVAHTREKLGPIGILIGNAGANPYYGTLDAIPDEAWAKTLDLNLSAQLRLARLVAPDMIAAGGGAMIFTSSIAAFRYSPGLGAYGVAKVALLGLVRNLAAEWGPRGIRVNAICPGLVRTEFARALWERPEAEERARREIPLRRLGEPEDVAGAAVFLAADAGRYVTGQAITVDGGTVMWG